jgi:hypothetical protein
MVKLALQGHSVSRSPGTSNRPGPIESLGLVNLYNQTQKVLP